MATNDFLPFAASTGATVLTQAQYAALGALANGFQVGVADEFAVNKVLRQSSTIASVIGKIIADYSGSAAQDSGNVASLEALFILALQTIRGNTSFLQAFTTSTTYVVPSGVSRALALVWAAGGGGGGSFGANSGASGGGGGGFAIGMIPLTPGASLPITVGVGGAAGLGSNPPTNGSSGGTSSVAGLASSIGGGGGAGGLNGIQTTFFGAAGVGVNGTANITGYPGGFAVTITSANYGSVLGGVGGSSFGSSIPSNNNSTTGNNGIFPGGGANGGAIGGSGGVGANGLVLLIG